jgi:hypothetical protein
MADQRKCGTCGWLRLPPGTPKPYHGHVYRCLWPMPEVAWPDSMKGRIPIISPYSMAPRDGVNCPQWKPREATP